MISSMALNHSMLLEFSMISQQIIHSFEVDTFWLSKLMKWMINGNDYLTFCNNVAQKEDLLWTWFVNFYTNP